MRIFEIIPCCIESQRLVQNLDVSSVMKVVLRLLPSWKSAACSVSPNNPVLQGNCVDKRNACCTKRELKGDNQLSRFRFASGLLQVGTGMSHDKTCLAGATTKRQHSMTCSILQLWHKPRLWTCGNAKSTEIPDSIPDFMKN